KAGYRVLAGKGGMSANLPQASLYGEGSALKEKGQADKKLVATDRERFYEFKTNRAQRKKIFCKRMWDEESESVRSTYEYFWPPFSYPPRVNLEGVRDTLQFYAEQNPDFKNRKPEEFLDQSLLDELEKEGFFKKLGQ